MADRTPTAVPDGLVVVVGEAACGGVGKALVDGLDSTRRSKDLHGLLEGGEIVREMRTAAGRP